MIIGVALLTRHCQCEDVTCLSNNVAKRLNASVAVLGSAVCNRVIANTSATAKVKAVSALNTFDIEDVGLLVFFISSVTHLNSE